jgi:uncharacterized protein YkwD
MLKHLILVLGCILAFPALACNPPENLEGLRYQVIQEVNAERAGSGLPPLQANTRLTRAAQGHACDNAGRGSYSHTGSNGSDLTDRLRAAGYRFRAAAENTGRGFGSPERAVDWWMNSSGHRANILMRGISDIGVGVAMGDGKPHWVLNFGATR